MAEQGREWGWASAVSVACFVISAVGLAAFIIIESKMGQDAILPLGLFRSGAFSMSSILGFLVGFGMFGAMMTIPLYLQIVVGLTPTESGFATLPMTLGIMIASIASGQIVARTGQYRIFPIVGTALMASAYFYLTFLTADRPFWFLMVGMFIMGLGLGQLMQSITLAAQNAVSPTYMGVASSGATFFRQIGGTMGTAVLLSVLFTAMPANITSAMSNEQDLKNALDAALTPAVAQAPENQGVMQQIWRPIVDPLQAEIQGQLDQVTQQAPTATNGGSLAVDWSDEGQRRYWVDQIAPTVADSINEQSGEEGEQDDSVSTSDTSYLNGADSRLTRPFMVGFTQSALSVYWVGLAATLLAFVLALFFKTPPLRTTSGLQESADAACSKKPK